MIKYLKQYADKTFEDLVNGLIWFDLPLRLKAIFAKLPTGGGDSRPYKVYKGLITQELTNNPVITVLENTIPGFTITPVRTLTGLYRLSFSNMLDVDKVYWTIETTHIFSGFSLLKEMSLSGTLIQILTKNGASASDNIMYKCPILIEVYN